MIEKESKLLDLSNILLKIGNILLDFSEKKIGKKLLDLDLGYICQFQKKKNFVQKLSFYSMNIFRGTLYIPPVEFNS